jgi:hypothetical protein
MPRCSNCGFLAVRDINTRQLEEVDGTFREWGRPPLKRVAGRNQYKGQYDIPICFVRAHNLYNEVIESGVKPELYYTIVKTVIDEDRQCDSFIEWHQGFTPKEHQEMLDRKEMLKWQAEREKEDKEWQQRQREIEHNWQSRQQLFLAIIAGIFTIIGGIIGVIITLIVNRLS